MFELGCYVGVWTSEEDGYSRETILYLDVKERNSKIKIIDFSIDSSGYTVSKKVTSHVFGESDSGDNFERELECKLKELDLLVSVENVSPIRLFFTSISQEECDMVMAKKDKLRSHRF